MTTSEVCAFCDGEMDARFILSIDGVALCEWCRELPADVGHFYGIPNYIEEIDRAWHTAWTSIIDRSRLNELEAV